MGEDNETSKGKQTAEANEGSQLGGKYDIRGYVNSINQLMLFVTCCISFGNRPPMFPCWFLSTFCKEFVIIP